ncbi:MAG TPA: hypothetical protein VM120_14690 [Bryobacteraceae bacterium]|nr:hypothetical protein [Bryobacteraceae bacterium]
MHFAAALVFLSFSLYAQQPYDLLITGARVVDGAGNPYFYADIAIQNDSIVAMGRLSSQSASLKIDARSPTVTPGFIDIHNHSYPDIYEEPTARGFLS